MPKRLAPEPRATAGRHGAARCPMYRIEISFALDSKRSPKAAERSGEGSLGYSMRGATRHDGRQIAGTGRLILATVASAGLWLSTAAAAQSTFTVGPGGRPSVEIDLGVVDAPTTGQQPITVAPGLAPFGSLPQQQLLYPGERSVGRITLTPPGSRTAPTLRRPPPRGAPAVAAVPREPVLSAPIPASKPRTIPAEPTPTPPPALRATVPAPTATPPAAAAPPAPRPPAGTDATAELRSTAPRIDTSRPGPPPAAEPAAKVAAKAPVAPSPSAAFPPPPAPLSKPPAAETRPLPAAPAPQPPPDARPAMRTAAAPPPAAALPRPPSTPSTPASPTVVAAPPPPPPPPLPAANEVPPAAEPPATVAAAPAAAPAVAPAAPAAALPTERAAPEAAGQMAALPPAGGDILQVEFPQGSSALSRGIEAKLGALAAQLKATDARLQLKAFASATGDNISRARRLSLSRALAVRSYLIEQGLRSTRIDVRALGIARDGGGADRVDVVLLSP